MGSSRKECGWRACWPRPQVDSALGNALAQAFRRQRTPDEGVRGTIEEGVAAALEPNARRPAS
jgi:hypothetical protein